MLAETTHNANVKNVHFNGITLRGAGYTGMIGKIQDRHFSQISVQNADVTTKSRLCRCVRGKCGRNSNFRYADPQIQKWQRRTLMRDSPGNAERITAQKVFTQMQAGYSVYCFPAKYGGVYRSGIGRQQDSI